MKVLFMVLVLSFRVSGLNAAGIKESAESYFEDEHFLKNSVNVPRVYDDASRDEDKDLDDLLHRLFKKIVSIRGVKTGDDAKIANNGVAYKNPIRIPTQDKRGEKSGLPTFDKNGIALPAKERTPGVSNNKRQQQSSGTTDDDVMSLKEITNSVDKLIDELSKKSTNTRYLIREDNKNTKKTVEKKFKFEEVDEESTNSTNSKELNGYKNFKDTFYKMFLKSNGQQQKSTGTDQVLINTGKDNVVPDTGRSGRFHENEAINEVEQTRLDKLYKELKQQTKSESEKIAAEVQKKKQVEDIKRGLLDMLNSIQHRETFTYDGEKFGLASRSNNHQNGNEKDFPDLINTGKDFKHRSGTSTSASARTVADETVAKRLDSRLETVERLIRELRELQGNRKRTVDRSGDGSLYKTETKRKSDGVVKGEDQAVKKEAISGKTDSKKALRGVLVDLVDELQKRIASSSSSEDKKQKPAASSAKRIEKELEEIASLSGKKQNVFKDNDATRKAIAGFNVDDEKDSLRERKEIQKSDRP